MLNKKLCVLTSNRHKFEEISEVAREFNIELDLCDGFKLEFQADTLEEIVTKSAMLAYIYLKRPLLVEDAGLFVEALNGFPGPYSNYVYRTIGINGLLKLLDNVSNRRACFKSAVALIHEGGVFISSGEVCGTISQCPRGSRGFGFDPVFIPDGETRTFAEMSISEKNRYSHRAKAVRKALALLLGGKTTTTHL